MPNILTDLVLGEISLVDEGANDGARVVIVKAKDDDDPRMTLHQFTEALEAVGDKLALLEEQVNEREVAVAKIKETIASQDAEIMRLTDPDVMLKAKAATIRDANPRLTAEQAYAQAVDQNPDLYTAYIGKRRASSASGDVVKQRANAAEALLKAKALEIRKSFPNVTQAQAYTRALEENPKLYGDYVAHRGLA
jgi:hypothetical protein